MSLNTFFIHSQIKFKHLRRIRLTNLSDERVSSCHPYFNVLSLMKRKNKNKKNTSYSIHLKRLSLVLILSLISITVYEIFRSDIQSGIHTLLRQLEQGQGNRVVAAYDDLDLPRMTDDRNEQRIHHTGYTVSYNSDWKIPNWVAYELIRDEVGGREKRTNEFKPDPLVRGQSADNADYTRSGYDRGHMAPAADMAWSEKVMEESFYFSNVCPQKPDLNRGDWKQLEEQLRSWAVLDSSVAIVCGPVVKNGKQRIGKNKVLVPDAFFKVVLCPYTDPIKGIGFIFSNKQPRNQPLRSYAVSIDEVENQTGIDFFTGLPDSIEAVVEASLNLKKWEW